MKDALTKSVNGKNGCSIKINEAFVNQQSPFFCIRVSFHQRINEGGVAASRGKRIFYLNQLISDARFELFGGRIGKRNP